MSSDREMVGPRPHLDQGQHHYCKTMGPGPGALQCSTGVLVTPPGANGGRISANFSPKNSTSLRATTRRSMYVTRVIPWYKILHAVCFLLLSA